MKVLCIGRTEILFETIVALAGNHEICGIITAPASLENAKREEDFQKLASDLGVPFFLKNKIDPEILEFIRRQKPQIGISINWVTIVEEACIDLFPQGILNAHFGDLPRYRGNAVINWAILNHEPEVVFSIHRMEPAKLDSGDVILQKKMPMSEETKIGDILTFARRNIPLMFVESIEGLARKSIRPMRQSRRKERGFRCFPRLPVDSKIDWTKSAREIHALIRASSHPYPGAYSFLKIDGKWRKVFFWDSKIVSPRTSDLGIPGHIIRNDKTTGESWVFTGKGILAVNTAQYEGEAEFSPGVVWKSIRMRFGVDCESEILTILQQLEQKALPKRSRK